MNFRSLQSWFWPVSFVYILFSCQPIWASYQCIKVFRAEESNKIFEFSGRRDSDPDNSSRVTFNKTQPEAEVTRILVEFKWDLQRQFEAFGKVGIDIYKSPNGNRVFLQNSSGEKFIVESVEAAFQKAIELLTPKSEKASLDDLKIEAYRTIWEYSIRGDYVNETIILMYPSKPGQPYLLEVFGLFTLRFRTEKDAHDYISEISIHGLKMPSEKSPQRTFLPEGEVPPFVVSRQSAREFERQFGIEYLAEPKNSKELGRSYFESMRTEARKQEQLDQEFWSGNKTPREVKEKLLADLSQQKKAIYELSQPELRLLYGRSLSNQTQANVSIRKVNDQIGYGVFAEAPIKAGEFIGEYTGYVRPGHINRSGMYSARLEDFYSVDAQMGGNFTRFINHSNNTNVTFALVFYGGRWRSFLVAIRDIEPGQQLLTSYGHNFKFDVTEQHLEP